VNSAQGPAVAQNQLKKSGPDSKSSENQDEFKSGESNQGFNMEVADNNQRQFPFVQKRNSDRSSTLPK